MRQRFSSILFLFVITGVVVLEAYGALTWLEDGIQKIFAPPQAIAFRAGERFREVVVPRDIQDLKKDVEQLQEKVTELSVANAKYLSDIRDTKILQKELDFVSQRRLETIPAKMVGQSRQNGRSVFLLNKGSRDGVRVGNPVIVSEGILLGTIVRVNKNLSHLRILTEDGSLIAATILNNFDTPGIVVGSRGLSLSMEQIPQDEKIQRSDMVVTSGLTEGIPQGLVIGRIDDISSDDRKLFQAATLELLHPLDRFSIVQIIQNP